MLRIVREPLAALRDFWLAAERDNPDMSPFQYYETTRLVSAHYLFFALKKRELPRFYSVCEGDRQLLVIPACRVYGRPGARYTSFGTTPMLALQNLIYPPDMTPERLSACLDAMAARFGRFEFHNVGEETLLYRVLAPRAERIDRRVNVRIPVAGDHETYFATLSKGTRQNVRTAYNRLRADGLEWRVETLRPGEVSPGLLAELMDVYIRRRRDRYGMASAVHEWFLRHYHYNTLGFSRLPEGRYVVLRVDGRVAAFWGGYLDRLNRYALVPRLAIDETFARYSPGMLLVNESMKLAAEWGLRCLDLSKGPEEYKYRMGGEEYYTYGFRLGG